MDASQHTATKLPLRAYLDAILHTKNITGTLDDILATYYDRSPEEIAADESRPQSVDEIGDLSRYYVLSVEHEQELLGSLGLAGLLPLDPPKDVALDHWRRVRNELLDKSVVTLIRGEGPEAFARPCVRAHLTIPWYAMRYGISQEDRRLARDRFKRIIRELIPDLRAKKDRRADPVRVAIALNEAQRILTAVRKRNKHTPARLAALRTEFRDWPKPTLDQLLEGVRSKDKREQRIALNRMIGARFGLEGGSVPAIAAEGRRILAKRRRAENGYRRLTSSRGQRPQ